MGQAVGGVLVWGTLLVFIAIFVLILYMLTRSKGVGFNIKFVSGNEPADTPAQFSQMPSTTAAPPQDNELLGFSATPAAPPDSIAGRDAFLKTLDGAERVLATFLVALHYLVLLAATVAMAWVYFKYPDDGNRDFMLFYCGVIYVIAVLGITLQISKTQQRLSARPSGPPLIDQLRSKFHINVRSAPTDAGFIDAAALERARGHVAAGGTVDEACALVDPRYQQMDGWKKSVFRKAVEMSLEKQG